MLTKDNISKKIFFHLIAISIVMLNLIDIEIAGFSKVIPLFDVMMIFYFVIFRQVFLLWFVFLLGLWNDAISGNPLGLTSIIYILLSRFFVVLNHKMMIRENFKQIWQQFTAFLFCFLTIKWALLSLLNSSNYNFSSIFIQFILTAIFYVVMHKFFDSLSQKFIEEN